MSGPATVKVEVTDCAVCGSACRETVARGRDYIYECCPEAFTMVRCTECGHHYLCPRPIPDQVGVIYPEHYATFTGAYTGKGTLGRIKTAVSMRRLKLFAGIFRKGCRVLDVGCGDGRQLLDIKSRYPKVEAWGLDWRFPEATASALEARGVKRIEGLVEKACLPEGTFDLVIMTQLIEHLWEPRKALENIFRATAPGGLLCVETPNTAGWDRRWFADGAWGGYYFPRHQNLFDHKGLARFLEEAGFEVVSRDDLTAPMIWIYSLRARALERGRRRLARFFGANPFWLGLFCVADLAARLAGRTTSNQRIIARKI